MSSPAENPLLHALRQQRARLFQIEPSAELDARFEQALGEWRAERSDAGRRRRWFWRLGIAAILLLAAGAGWLVLRTDERKGAAVVENPGYLRVKPTDSAVVRLQASLGAPIPVWAGNGFPAHRRRYWVDVGVAGDGSLYIERVTPIDESPEVLLP